MPPTLQLLSKEGEQMASWVDERESSMASWAEVTEDGIRIRTNGCMLRN